MPPRNKPEYLKTHILKSKRIEFSLKNEAASLLDKARESKSGRTAKTLVKEGPLRLTLVALRKGVGLKKHSVDGQSSIHVLQGVVRFASVGSESDVKAGSVIVFDKGVEHDASARSDSVFLITMSYRGK